MHATNCHQSTACLYLLATRSCKACNKQPCHAFIYSCYNSVLSVLTCECSSVHILYQLGLTELVQQRSKAPKGSVPALVAYASLCLEHNGTQLSELISGGWMISWNTNGCGRTLRDSDIVMSHVSFQNTTIIQHPSNN